MNKFCPKCGGNVIKKGWSRWPRNGQNGARQRYKCKKCGHRTTKPIELSPPSDSAIFVLNRNELVENYKKINKQSLSVRKDLVVSDLHAPDHDTEAFRAMLEYAKFYKPDGVVCVGDVGNFNSISHWLHDKRRKLTLEGQRVKADIESAKDVLNQINLVTTTATKRTVTEGNHEHWMHMFVDKHPVLEGLDEMDIATQYGKMGYDVIEMNVPYENGKLLMFHGLYTGKYHTNKTLIEFGCSCLYGHTHDHQVFEGSHWKDRHMAMSIGCLCNQNPDYIRNRPTKWVHGFATVDFFSNGNFTVDFINIINGNFSRQGKIYGG